MKFLIIPMKLLTIPMKLLTIPMKLLTIPMKFLTIPMKLFTILTARMTPKSGCIVIPIPHLLFYQSYNYALRCATPLRRLHYLQMTTYNKKYFSTTLETKFIVLVLLKS